MVDGSAQLDVDHLTLEFGGVRALDDVTFSVGAGICGLIGPNGAGKTSLLNCVTGFYRPTAGAITVDGVPLLGTRRHRLLGHGIARTFQNLALFDSLSVFDNVAAGAGGRVDRAAVWELLERFDLVPLAGRPATGLPFGTLKRVELARALVSRPRLLLLDEPAGGLTHSEVDELGGLIRDAARESGAAVLLVEHHMGLILSVCERIVVMDSGRVIADGPADVVRDDPAVVAAYLGGGQSLAAR